MRSVGSDTPKPIDQAIVATNSALSPLHLAQYDRIPDPDNGFTLFEVDVQRLQPTQMCIGLAEVRSRQRDFLNDSEEERQRYLRTKPVPLVRNRSGALWMVDRHHRLRALLEMGGKREMVLARNEQDALPLHFAAIGQQVTAPVELLLEQLARGRKRSALV